jgi:hypothetical protein
LPIFDQLAEGSDIMVRIFTDPLIPRYFRFEAPSSHSNPAQLPPNAPADRHLVEGISTAATIKAPTKFECLCPDFSMASFDTTIGELQAYNSSFIIHESRHFSGAYELGVLISYILLGVTTTQAYVYYSRFPNDSRKLKYLVAFMW